jgi:hypothetical protein
MFRGRRNDGWPARQRVPEGLSYHNSGLTRVYPAREMAVGAATRGRDSQNPPNTYKIIGT